MPIGLKSLFSLLLMTIANFPFEAIAQNHAHFRHLKTEGAKRTRQIVFLRELGIETGDRIENPDSMCNVWQKRISGLGLFNHVEVYWEADTLNIQVAEKIYTWILPELTWADRNFNVWWQTRDPGRLIYGGTLYINNIRGLNHNLAITAIHGYNRQYSLTYNKPFNQYRKSWGMTAGGGYWSNHELWYRTENDKLQFLRIENQPVQKNWWINLNIKRRITYFSRFELIAGAGNLTIADSAFIKDEANVRRYFTGANRSRNYMDWGISYINDHRDQRDYPARGYLVRLTALNTKLNLENRGPSVYTFDLRTSGFQPLKKGLIMAGYLGARYRTDVNSLTVGSLPYVFARQLGYGNDYVRGYEPYVADGSGMVLGKAALRKALYDKRTVALGNGNILKNYRKVPFSAWLSIFADAGRVIRPVIQSDNRLNTDWMTGAGIGLEMIAWYNAMSRFEISRNRLGTWVFNISYTNAF